jgi:NAD(P)-dependent dehydrogenase (short-subunit alcohol dehydrogenase family)
MRSPRKSRRLGIKVTCVEPGPFRTDWAGRSLQQRRPAISDYNSTVGARLEATATIAGSSPAIRSRRRSHRRGRGGG